MEVRAQPDLNMNEWPSLMLQHLHYYVARANAIAHLGRRL